MEEFKLNLNNYRNQKQGYYYDEKCLSFKGPELRLIQLSMLLFSLSREKSLFAFANFFVLTLSGLLSYIGYKQKYNNTIFITKIMRKTDGLKIKPSTASKTRPINALQSKLFDHLSTMEANDTTAKAMQSSYRNNWTTVKQPSASITQSSFNKYGTAYKNQYRPSQKDEEQQFKIVGNVQDPLAKLISKAKNITTANQDKIQKQKMRRQRQLKVAKKQGGPFLTSTGIYAVQPQQTNAQQPDFECDVDPNQMLKDLVRKQQNDDLEQLRRMIRITGHNLDDYSKQIYHSSKGVMSAADQFNKQVDCVLLHKVHKVKVPKMEANGIDHNPKKKASSLNRIKDPKYL